MNKKLKIIISILLLLVIGYTIVTSTKKISEEEIKTIEEKVTYDRASTDLITVELPFLGAVTGKEFSVIGKARGMWFFEASFPIDVLDKDEKILVQTFATAQGEWMTENFVSFKGEVKVPASYIGPATLVLKKDNASGLPEHDAHISFPFIIEY